VASIFYGTKLSSFGLFNYNFGQVGGVNITVCDSSGLYTSLVNDIVASWPVVAQSLCIVNYAVGVSGAQYSLATVKGSVPGSTNSFPEPPPLDLSTHEQPERRAQHLRGMVSSGLQCDPTNSTTTSPSLTIVTPTQQNATSPFGISGTIIAYTNAPTLFYRVDNGAWDRYRPDRLFPTSHSPSRYPGRQLVATPSLLRTQINTSVVVSSGSFQVVLSHPRQS